MFNPDDDDFHSDPGDELAMDVDDALARHQQLVDMKTQAMALQAQIHLDSVASEGSSTCQITKGTRI